MSGMLLIDDWGFVMVYIGQYFFVAADMSFLKLFNVS